MSETPSRPPSRTETLILTAVDYCYCDADPDADHDDDPDADPDADPD